MLCRICKKEINLIGEIKNTAYQVSILFDIPSVSNNIDLKLYHCDSCDFFQIPFVNKIEYYDNYLMTQSHSQSIQLLQRSQVRRLYEFSKYKESLLEIGCGDGAFLENAKKYFKNVMGIEPSKAYYDICISKGLNVKNEYLTGDTSFNCLFDGFSSRQVFEHVDNPVYILKAAYKLLKDDAVGLIEVPNSQKMITENRYFDLFSDHVNYFTPMSLCKLAKMCNFDVIMVTESFGGDYLELYVRKSTRKFTNLEAKRKNDISAMMDVTKKYKNVSVYGAGAKAQVIMASIGDSIKLNYIFDTDINKHGKYLGNSKVKVEKPDAEKISRNDLIIIFAASYNLEITKLLRDSFKYSGDILILSHDLCILKNE